MKRLILASLCSLICLIAFGVPRNKETAQQEALAFFKSKNITISQVNLAKVAKSSISTAGSETSSYYIFNAGNDKGFVIISGNDAAPKVLGYSDEGSFDADNMPDNVKNWLDCYDAVIKQIPENAVPAAPTSPDTRKTIDPICKTFWTQDKPYNNLCPSSAPTGCTATAMAQVLYTHKWPKTASTAIPAYKDYYNKSYSALDPVTFDWDNMLLSYTSSYTTAQATAVATLMKYCGWAAEMSYSSGGSGAYLNDAVYGLANYLGYDSCKDVARDSYTADAWNDLIYNELAKGNPVVYSGYLSTNSNEGHTFVCDGYDGDDYFHINWGWGKNYNGEYLLSILDYSSSYKYSSSQECIINLTPGANPGEAGTVIPNGDALRLKSMSASPVTITRNEASSAFVISEISTEVYNVSIVSRKFDSGVGLFDTEGNLISVLTSNTSTYSSNPYYYYYDGDIVDFSDVSIESGTADGTYYLKAVSRASGADKWIVDDGSEKNRVEITLSTVSTGINNVETETRGYNKIYDLQGRKISNPQEGIYIVNGKKIIIK